MRKIFALILIILSTSIILCGCGKKKDKDLYEEVVDRGKLIVGVRADTEPFGYKDSSGNFVGFEPDLARKIAKVILGDENRVEFVPVTASSRISMLNGKKVDMLIATMTITQQRMLVVDFTSPYYIAGQAMLVPSGSKISSPAELNGKSVITVYGTVADKYIRIIAPNASIRGYKTYDEAYKALKAGKSTAILSDNTILMGYAIKDKSLKLVPLRFSREPYGVVFRKELESEKLRDKVEMIVTGMQSDGSLNQLRTRWLK